MRRNQRTGFRMTHQSRNGILTLAFILLCGTAAARTLTSTAGNTSAAVDGFLSDVLPLRVVTTTPSILSGDNVMVRDQQAITVAYSRSVVALGQDFDRTLPQDKIPFTFEPKVRGRFRWVTTSIARWDPEDSWPLDSDIKLVWNKKLTSHDGVLLQLEERRDVTFTTGSLRISNVLVESQKASNLTDGEWNPFTGVPATQSPEVPPDGILTLTFSHEVSLTSLQKHLEVHEASLGKPAKGLKLQVASCKKNKRLSLKPCLRCALPKMSEMSEEEDECAEITIQGDLKVATGYNLFLPNGTRYSSNAGPLKISLRSKFGGLRKFTIPFDTRQTSFPRSTRFYGLWLPHGLKEGSQTDVQLLKDQFTIHEINIIKEEEETEEEIGQEVDFELELERKTLLRIAGPFAPDQKYRIKVQGSRNILNGFGLPLEASGVNFTVSSIKGRFSTFSAGPYQLFEAGQDWGHKIVAVYKGLGGSTCRAFGQNNVNILPVTTPNHFAAVARMLHSGSRSILGDFLENSDEQLSRGNASFADIVEYNVSDALDYTGLVAYGYCEHINSERVGLLIESELQATILGTPTNVGIVWVTSMKTGKPIAGANVSLLNVDEEPVEVEFINTTDEEGVAMFTEMSQADHVAHVQYGNKSLFVEVNRGDRSHFRKVKGQPRQRAELVLDRALAKKGDTLHIKGYTQGFNLSEPVAVSVSPALSSQGPFAFPVELDPKFGTFELDLPIPEDARNREYELSLLGEGRLNSRISSVARLSSGTRISSVAGRSFDFTESFTVGDPRPPTVELTLDTPFWAKPDSKVLVNLTAESLIGAAVGGARMSLKWRVQDISRFSDSLEGEFEVVMDASGRNVSEIDLGSFEEPPSESSELIIDVSWVGPTRELIEETATIRLRRANLELYFERTVTTDFPGQEFGVKLVVTDLNEAPIRNRNMLINLKEFDSPAEGSSGFKTLDSKPTNGTVIDSCSVKSDSQRYACRFTVPGIGQYILETCTRIASEAEEFLCMRERLGKSLEQWENDFLKDMLPMSLKRLAQGPFRMGDEIQFGIENPYLAARALIMWGSRDSVKHKTVDLEDASFSPFSIQLGKECEIECALSVGVAVPRQVEGLALNEAKVPSSKLLDLAMPREKNFEQKIELAAPEALEVDLDFPELVKDEENDLVMAPGETTRVQINVTNQLSKGETEVTVMAVDKSILELIPYDLKNLTEALRVLDEVTFGYESSSQNLLSPKAIAALIDDFNRRKEIHPWFTPTVRLASYDSGTDESNQTIIDSARILLTQGPRFPFRGRKLTARASSSAIARSGSAEALPIAFALSIAAPSSADSGVEGDFEATITGSARVLEDFVANALFQTVVVENGLAVVNFTAPDNLGTFNFKAYAATGEGQYGSVEKEVIVRRVVSLTPSAPRFVRVGDTFEAGAVVTVSGSKPAGVDVGVNVELLDTESMELKDAKAARSIKLGEDGNAEVRFYFKATKIGEARFKISADAGSGATDALVINFPVEGLQDAVTVATSFALNGSASANWTEGLQIPDSIPGSGSISVQGGVGRLPAILSLASQLYERHACPIYADHALAVASIPLVTEVYKVLDGENSAFSGSIANTLGGMVSNFSASVESLQKLTRPGIGLDCLASCVQYPRTFPGSPLFVTNAKGLFLMNMLDADLNGNEREGISNQVEVLTDLRKRWAVALEDAIVDSISRNPERNLSAWRLAFAKAALGAGWTPAGEKDPQILRSLSMERLSEEFDDMGTDAQAYYVIALLSTEEGVNHPDVKKAIQMWTSNFRVTGRTAYIARAEGSATPASNVANSLALMVMVRAKVDGPFVERLANYIGSPPVSPYGFRVFSTYDKTVAMIAMRDYDVDRGSAQPNLRLAIRSGDVALLNAQFVPGTSPVVSNSASFEELGSRPKPLEFQANGTGEVTIAASMTFIPSRLLPSPTYQGIFVQRSISIADSDNTNSLKTIPVKSVVDVAIQVTTPDRLGPATVRALMPAGLEPVDPAIAGDPNFCPIPFSRLFFSVYFFFQCPDQETEPSVVTFRFNSMQAGTQTLRFRAVAATAGRFALPPVKASVDDFPEVMGLSSAGELVVCTGKGCVPEEDVPAAIPKLCPASCNNNGFCDVDTGTCECFDGFKGNDCKRLAFE